MAASTDPGTRRPAAEPLVRVPVCRLEELPAGTSRVVDVGEHGVGVFNVDGALHALTNRCPHMGAPLCLGPITGTVAADDRPYGGVWAREGEILRCPWHSWEFDIATGRTLTSPVRAVRKYSVFAADGEVVLEVPASMVKESAG